MFGWVLDGNSAIWQPCSIMGAELFYLSNKLGLTKLLLDLNCRMLDQLSPTSVTLFIMGINISN
jgi:hypothetical protein